MGFHFDRVLKVSLNCDLTLVNCEGGLFLLCQVTLCFWMKIVFLERIWQQISIQKIYICVSLVGWLFLVLIDNENQNLIKIIVLVGDRQKRILKSNCISLSVFSIDFIFCSIMMVVVFVIRGDFTQLWNENSPILVVPVNGEVTFYSVRVSNSSNLVDHSPNYCFHFEMLKTTKSWDFYYEIRYCSEKKD